jgi:bacillithiol synthase
MRIPFGGLPSMSALFLDYVSDWSRVRNFYPQPYTLDSIISFGRKRPRLEPSHREKLCAALWEQQRDWNGDAASVSKLAEGAVAVIAGQQPGLFTGPHYTILKALTIIKLAKALDQAGIPAVPVFWVAAEDHDFEEIQWTAVLNRDGGLQRISIDLSNAESRPVAWLQLGGDIVSAISTCFSSLPDSEFQPHVRDLVESSYKPAVSPVDAFGRMMATLFKNTGLILANPLHPELKRLAASTVTEAVRQNSAIRAAVLARSRALSDAGYHPQVKVDNHFTGLFAYRGKSRQALRPEEIESAESLSPNVLLRPAVQDAIFPTVAYVGGPAEIAYFAQAGAVYETLQRPMPPVFPRISVSILESRVSRALKKYEMEFVDVFRGREFMKHKAVASVQGVELFDDVRDHVTAQLESLRPALNAVDPTLAGALDTSRQKVIHQVEALRTKFVNAEARRNETLERHMDAIANSLYPEKKLQERMINITSFLMRYGLDFVGRLEQELSLDSREHQVIEL